MKLRRLINIGLLCGVLLMCTGCEVWDALLYGTPPPPPPHEQPGPGYAPPHHDHGGHR